VDRRQSDVFDGDPSEVGHAVPAKDRSARRAARMISKLSRAT
jgi:hypothetical protein